MVTTRARGIKLAVGRNGRNLDRDVRVIQELLNAALERNPKFKESGFDKLKVDGDFGAKTEHAILKYQEKVLGWSGAHLDATVEPGRTTWKSLNGNVGSVSAIRKQVVARPATVNGYQAFRQGDYSSVQLGSGDLRISGHGCALCTLTMAATTIGAPSAYWPEKMEPRNLTPPIVNDILVRAGAFSRSLLVMSKAANALGMSYDEYGRTEPATPDDVKLIELNLRYGYPVAGHVDYKSSGIGDHWILLVRRTAGTEFDAIDPATGRLLKLTSAPQSSMDGPRVTRTTNIENGVLFGWGRGGSNNQQKYIIVRFALLSPAAGGLCTAE